MDIGKGVGWSKSNHLTPKNIYVGLEYFSYYQSILIFVDHWFLKNLMKIVYESLVLLDE